MKEGKKEVKQEPAKKLGEEWIYIHKNELKKLRSYERKSDELQVIVNRIKTEFAEYQERVRREKENIKKFALEGFLIDLLPLLDTLDSTIASFKDPKIQQGIEMVRKAFLKQLIEHGVEEIKTKGSHFDPNLHEAIDTVEDDSVEPDTIVEELKKGYVYNGKTLRPAMVRVSKKKEAEGNSGTHT